MIISSNTSHTAIQQQNGTPVKREEPVSVDVYKKTDEKPLELIPAPSQVKIDPFQDAPWAKDQRPAKNLGTTEDGHVLIGDARCGFNEVGKPDDWQPVFGNVSVDPSKLKDAYIVLEPFAPEWAAGHTFAYFEFEKGGVKTPDGKDSKGIVVSIEARMKEGQSYGLLKGMKDNFKIVYQVGTWEDTIQKCSRRRGHKIIRHKLNLNKDEKQALLKKELSDSFENRENEFYHTLKNSCYSNQVRMINTVLPEDRRQDEWIIQDLIKTPGSNLPTALSYALGSKGIIEDKPPIITAPDKELHPDKQVKPSFMKKLFKKISEADGWDIMTGITGIVLGTALGTLALPAIIALPTLGLLGGIIGEHTGNWIERESHAIIEPSEIYSSGINTHPSPESNLPAEKSS